MFQTSNAPVTPIHAKTATAGSSIVTVHHPTLRFESYQLILSWVNLDAIPHSRNRYLMPESAVIFVSHAFLPGASSSIDLLGVPAVTVNSVPLRRNLRSAIVVTPHRRHLPE